MSQFTTDKTGRLAAVSSMRFRETLFTWTHLFSDVNWENVFWVMGLPAIGLFAAVFTPLQFKTALWATVYHVATGIGITAGYHRLWAHRSYNACLGLKIWLAAFGGGAIENSIRTWSRDHRAHHRYTDTEKDPYSVRKGLLYAHIGWLVFKQDPKTLGRVDVSDLDVDPIVIWQHNHYPEIALVMGFILPSVVAALWSDWWGGLIYAGILRAFAVQQSTFCVNSIAHWLGDQTFDDRNSPRDHLFTALITAGEGYHNFHHEFPSDYRNGIAWYQFDPTKWCIYWWKLVGLADNLKEFRQNEIEKGRVQQHQKRLNRNRAHLQQQMDQLPLIDWDEFQQRVMDGSSFVAIAGFVHDVSSFIPEHPGGEILIRGAVGKDATAAFNGGVYNHSRAAHGILKKMQVGILRGGCEVEIRKRTRGNTDPWRISSH